MHPAMCGDQVSIWTTALASLLLQRGVDTRGLGRGRLSKLGHRSNQVSFQVLPNDRNESRHVPWH